MSDYREGCIERQAVRRGIVEPRPIAPKAKKPAGAVIVERRYLPETMFRGRDLDWRMTSRCRNQRVAQEHVEQMNRKHARFAEYRIKP